MSDREPVIPELPHRWQEIQAGEIYLWNSGLIPSQEEGYDLKSKILGKGGDRRFHGKIVADVLHFPGKMPDH